MTPVAELELPTFAYDDPAIVGYDTPLGVYGMLELPIRFTPA